jgi:hypothetical protein
VQLEQLDPLQAEQTKAALGLRSEVLRLAVAFPAVRAGTGEARLGRDDEIVRVGMERLVDQPFADPGAVGVGRVDQRHAQLERAAKHADHLVVVARLTPHAGTRDLHRAVPQPHDRQVAADRELTAGTSGLRREVVHDDAFCLCAKAA